MPVTLAYLHTSPVLIPMFRELSHQELPGVEQFHMVDESLIRNTIREGRLTKTTIRRVQTLLQVARDGGADAVLLTCSTLGPAAQLARSLFDFPVIRVDDAMAEKAVRTGRRIGVAATLPTTLEPTVALLRDKAQAAHLQVEVVEGLCDGAYQAVISGDTATHDRLLTDLLRRLMGEVDVIVLAQPSMARVVDALPADFSSVPILATPRLAVQSARAILFPEPAPALSSC